MINKVITITEENAMYNEIVKEMSNATDDKLVIVAKSYKNRKDDRIKPIAIKNGIYFYLAYDLDGDGKTAYPGKVTPEQIYKAKANMVRRARLGSMMDLCYSSGTKLEDYEPSEMNVTTLGNKMYGAGLLYCEEFLKVIKEKIGDCYILPSSIHEIIFVPVGFASIEELTAKVQAINATGVSEDDYLADRAFKIDEWI